VGSTCRSEKRKEKKRKERGGLQVAARLACLAGPRAWPSWVAAPFFVLFLFFAFYFVLFEKAKLFEKINFKFCQLLNKVLMCLATHKTLFGKV
jgi:hypothetical protein